VGGENRKAEKLEWVGGLEAGGTSEYLLNKAYEENTTDKEEDELDHEDKVWRGGVVAADELGEFFAIVEELVVDHRRYGQAENLGKLDLVVREKVLLKVEGPVGELWIAEGVRG